MCLAPVDTFVVRAICTGGVHAFGSSHDPTNSLPGAPVSPDVAKCFLSRNVPCWSTNTDIRVIHLSDLKQESAGGVLSYLLRNLAEQQLSVAHLVVGLLQLHP